MHDKRRKILKKYLIKASNADDVISSHAYGAVARSHKPIPKRRPSETQPGGGTVANYRNSMVGSISQYHDRTPAGVKKPNVHKDTEQEKGNGVIGNRPASAATDTTKKDKTAKERRHHFIEPPKRSFHRFD